MDRRIKDEKILYKRRVKYIRTITIIADAFALPSGDNATDLPTVIAEEQR